MLSLAGPLRVVHGTARLPPLAGCRIQSVLHASKTRHQSTRTAITPHSQYFTANKPLEAFEWLQTRPFAIEHVDGRARHLTWAQGGRVSKEWRELQAAPGTRGDMVHRASRLSRVTAWLRQMFLPTNYPQSVHPSSVFIVLRPWSTQRGLIRSQLLSLPLATVCGVHRWHACVCPLQPGTARLGRRQRRRQYLRGRRRPVDHQRRGWRGSKVVFHSQILSVL